VSTRSKRTRTAKSFSRSRPKKSAKDRVLIVCEGAKTEPNYLDEIRQTERLSAVNLKIMQSARGTEPQQIVESADDEYKRDRGYDRIYVIFDCDDHKTYVNALNMSAARHGKRRNDENRLVSFEAIVSVPCFEFWLLLHFSDVQAWFHRDEIGSRLRAQLPSYEKGATDIYSRTEKFLALATERASKLKKRFNRYARNEPYTDVHELVAALKSLAP
jgi:RloB-like protein